MQLTWWHRSWLGGVEWQGETEGTAGRFIFNNTVTVEQSQNEMFASNKPQVAGVVQSEIINTNKNKSEIIT